MKRAILRLAALAAVVVLGVVVIVRAQRGAEPDPSGGQQRASSTDSALTAAGARAADSSNTAYGGAVNPLRGQPAAAAAGTGSAGSANRATPGREWPLGNDPFAMAAAHGSPSGSGGMAATPASASVSDRAIAVVPAADYRNSPQDYGDYGVAGAAHSSPDRPPGTPPELMPDAGPPDGPMMPAAGGLEALGAAPPGPEGAFAGAAGLPSGQGTQVPVTLPGNLAAPNAEPGNLAAPNAEPGHLPADLSAIPATSSGFSPGPAYGPDAPGALGSASARPGPAGPHYQSDGPSAGWPQIPSAAGSSVPLEGGISSIPSASAEVGGYGAGAASGLGEGTGRPGSKDLEGPQTPQVTIQKIAPETVQVGQLATFRLLVRNTGSVVATDVEVRDEVPKGSRLVQSDPQAARGAAGELVWKLGSLPPGQEATIDVQIVPLEEGELGSVARVSFQAQATARCLVTKPELVLQVSAPEQVLIGEQLDLTILVSNIGSGPARGVVLEEHVPGELQHPAGAALEYVVGDLQPGESRQLELALTALRPGPTINLLLARGEGNLHSENRLALEVVAPRLEVAIEGPQRRFLEREASYQFSVANPGTAPAEQVDLVVYLPPGLEFVRANNAGYYEPSDHTVRWRLEQLPVNERGTVELVAMPVQAGQHELKLRAAAARGAQSETVHPVLIEGIAALLFQAADEVDPIQVGEETSYEIRVVNQGTKAATGVMLAVLAPPEMQPVAAEGPTAHTIDAQNRVLFQPLARLAPKADTTYRVRVRGLRPGDLRVRVQLMADEMQAPVTKEESTRVYSDQ